METSFPVTVLIAAPEGIQSSALRTYLETLPGVRVVGRSASQAEALQDLANCQPRLLLLDCSLNNEGGKTCLSMQPYLAQVYAMVPTIQVIALAGDRRQKQLALEAGAIQVILKGGFDQPLRQAVERLSLSLSPS
jgi:DNA-binding NarL/FixJ family response regulator